MAPQSHHPLRRPVVRAALLVGALALSACANPGGFGGAGGAGGPGAGAQATAAPNSPQYFRETVGDRVLFEVDQSSLTSVARNTLSAQARWLSQNPEYRAIIEGHADEQGTREYNLALGARRANSVQEYLIGQGVAGTRLRTVSYGKERPIAVCSDESCYRQNRRAVTVLEAGAGS
ncbi:peptidoglycan-associated lipoprotein Pal [Rhodovulum sp. 12E13]|uniref:peptidoglycan-associated lipoprotein Pal n=1 Tax=Rhodovulum sp. 12E13 TaxID=2203891 RepID=UPI000E180CD3|nr:peptidoglycan-associated lipoprotein Pal [Rhodovulum sp. 12E13]RDC73309.1 peptidoglycan-associated lipoprotein Pal [Rhodovulum sp. 12E13]